MKLYNLEKKLGCFFKSILLRRNAYQIPNEIQYKGYDYKSIYKKNCENVIGFQSIPIGIAGPLHINKKKYHIPLATTEGALVASVNRGCSLFQDNNITTTVEDYGMTRAPIVQCNSLDDVIELKDYIKKKSKDVKRNC